MKLFLINILVVTICFADNPRFSQTPLKIPMYNGIERRLGYPEFVDLDNDNDFDIVFMRDFDGPNYPIYYCNEGTDSIPQYVRDKNMFAWLDGQFMPWNLIDLRMLDLDNDSDFDFVLFYRNDFYVSSTVLYENIGDSYLPQWSAVGDTIFQNLGEVREINISNVLGDSLPQIIVISDSMPKFYRQMGDSLIELPNYFNNIPNLGYSGWGKGTTKIGFFNLPQDTVQYLFVNLEEYSMLVYYYQIFEIYKNVGSKFQPYWELQGSKKGHCRFLRDPNSMHPDKYCFSGGFWSFSILFDELLISPTEVKFQHPGFWINGGSTNYKDITSFDWQTNGSQDIIFNCNNLWQEWDGWGYDSNFNMFFCLPDFQIDSAKTNYPFDFNFPLNVFEDNDPASLYFDFADLDADNDNDLMILKADNGYLGVSPFLRIYWNTVSDILPSWDSTETIPFNQAHMDKSLTLEDLDGDGDYDLIVSKSDLPNIERFLGIFENIGSAFHPIFSIEPDTLIKINYAHPTFADLDADGDKDMIVQYDTTISSIRYQKLRFYRNDSFDTNFVFTRVDSILPEIDNISSPHLVDIDNDTDYDLFLLSNNSELYFVENLTITDIPDNSIQLPFGYHLYQNYPNPFNSHTTMKYYLPKPNQVKVEIYDVLGQKVKTLINQPQNSGMHQVVWNGRDENGNSVSSGVYIYNLTSGNYSASKKLLLLK